MTEPQPPPLQADSPTALFDGRVVERYRPPGVGGGDFAVDLANAPRAIRELEEAARNSVRSRRRRALGRVTPPSQDQVSLDAAHVLGVSAVGGNGSFIQALDHGIQQIASDDRGHRGGARRYGARTREHARPRSKPSLGWAIGCALAVSTVRGVLQPCGASSPDAEQVWRARRRRPRDVTPYAAGPCDGSLSGGHRSANSGSGTRDVPFASPPA